MTDGQVRSPSLNLPLCLTEAISGTALQLTYFSQSVASSFLPDRKSEVGVRTDGHRTRPKTRGCVVSGILVCRSLPVHLSRLSHRLLPLPSLSCVDFSKGDRQALKRTVMSTPVPGFLRPRVAFGATHASRKLGNTRQALREVSVSVVASRDVFAGFAGTQVNSPYKHQLALQYKRHFFHFIYGFVANLQNRQNI